MAKAPCLVGNTTMGQSFQKAQMRPKKKKKKILSSLDEAKSQGSPRSVKTTIMHAKSVKITPITRKQNFYLQQLATLDRNLTYQTQSIPSWKASFTSIPQDYLSLFSNVSYRNARTLFLWYMTRIHAQFLLHKHVFLFDYHDIIYMHLILIYLDSQDDVPESANLHQLGHHIFFCK